MSSIVQTWNSINNLLGGGGCVAALQPQGIRFLWKPTEDSPFIACNVGFWEMMTDPEVAARMAVTLLRQEHANARTRQEGGQEVPGGGDGGKDREDPEGEPA